MSPVRVELTLTVHLLIFYTPICYIPTRIRFVLNRRSFSVDIFMIYGLFGDPNATFAVGEIISICLCTKVNRV